MIRFVVAVLILVAPLAAQDKPAVEIEQGVMMPNLEPRLVLPVLR